MKIAFIDNKDGYYEYESIDSEIPSWAVGMTQTAIRVPPILPIIITKVTMRQARLELLQAGLLAAVETNIAAMTGVTGDAARITWEFSSVVERNNPLITQLGTSLNLTSAQLDNLFTLASTL